MEGLTDPIMRDVLTHVGSFDWCVTEFIRITDSILPDHIYYSFCPELKTQVKPQQAHLCVQFLGNNPEMLAAMPRKLLNSALQQLILTLVVPLKLLIVIVVVLFYWMNLKPYTS
jgi:tRNA-dihydrouridine synthase C